MAWAGVVCRSERVFVEVCGGGVPAAAGDGFGLEIVAGVHGPGDGDPHQHQRALFQCVFRVRDFLGAAQTLPQESVYCGWRVVAGECPHSISDAWKRRARLSATARMDFRKFAAAGGAFDFCKRVAIPGTTVRKFLLLR